MTDLSDFTGLAFEIALPLGGALVSGLALAVCYLLMLDSSRLCGVQIVWYCLSLNEERTEKRSRVFGSSRRDITLSFFTW